MIPAPEFMDIKPGRERNNLMYFEPVLIFALCIKIVVNGFLSFYLWMNVSTFHITYNKIKLIF